MAIAGNNVVKDGVCQQLVLTDGHSFGTPKAFTAQTVTYTHTGLGSGRSTLYLPFTPDLYPAEAAFYTIGDYSNTNGVEKTVAAPQAYTPLFVEHKGNLTLSASNASIEPEPASADPLMVGSLKNEQPSNKLFDISGIEPFEATMLVPFRAYGTEELVNYLPTGINGVEIDDAEPEVYTLMGMRLNCSVKDLSPGIYIVNGKKTVIK